MLRDLRRLGHQRFVDMGAAGGVEQQHVIAAELGGLQRALGDARPGPGRRRWGAWRRRSARRAREAALAPLASAYRARPSALSSCRGSAGARASLAVVVVLPEPCRPTSIITTGGVATRSIGSASAPSMRTSSSCTILMTIWPGVMERTTSWPTAFAFTASVKSRTTSSATSASSSARRTSRIASLTSASSARPCG